MTDSEKGFSHLSIFLLSTSFFFCTMTRLCFQWLEWKELNWIVQAGKKGRKSFSFQRDFPPLCFSLGTDLFVQDFSFAFKKTVLIWSFKERNLNRYKTGRSWVDVPCPPCFLLQETINKAVIFVFMTRQKANLRSYFVRSNKYINSESEERRHKASWKGKIDFLKSVESKKIKIYHSLCNFLSAPD